MDIKNEYIKLLKNVLIGLNRINVKKYKAIKQLSKNLFECQLINENLEARIEGKDWPYDSESMIGLKRMSNIEFCVKEVIENKIEGDFIETGVWKGGTCVFMKGILKAYGVNDRIVWVADSFEGLPKPNEHLYPEDIGDFLYTIDELRISEDEVRNNFAKYSLLDENVKFLKGWFKDTMPGAPINKLSILRLDGDMYESTIDVLIYLYPKLSVGGYCIIDDWGAIPACKKAVEDYRMVYEINEPIEIVDWTGVFWKKIKIINEQSKEKFFLKLEKKKKLQEETDYLEFTKLGKVFVLETKKHLNEVDYQNIKLVDNKEGYLSFLAETNDPKIILPRITFSRNNRIVIFIDIYTRVTTRIQLFFQTQSDKKFTEKNSLRQILKEGRQKVFFYLSGKEINGHLRLDPANCLGNFTIFHFEIAEDPLT